MIPATNLTLAIAAKTAALGYDDLSAAAKTVAGQCLLDWLGVTIAARAEPLVEILVAERLEAGCAGTASLIGRRERLTLPDAVMVNGAMSHALDYDDVHFTMHGHPSVPVVPVVLGLGEARRTDGRAALTALVAGLEAECRVGAYCGAAHYARGWHATGTIGTFGAAAAAARLLGLDAGATAQAFGIAGTQAAGLKAVFGTMCKPLHAGKAAANGLLAARLAARGFSSQSDILACEQGFAATQSAETDAVAALADPVGGFHIPATLFKYHAACYLTHAAIEAAALLRQAGVRPELVRAVTVRVGPGHLRVCNIQAPRTGLEAKFSLRFTVAMALAGEDTARDDLYSDATAQRPDLVALRDKVAVLAADGLSQGAAAVEVTLNDGRSLAREFDVGRPLDDLAEQGRKLEAKFMSLVAPILGAGRAERIAACCRALDRLPDIGELTRQCLPD